MSWSGHYAGATSQGQPISFDLTEDGAEVTNVLVTVDGERGRSRGSVVLSISRRFRVGSRGAWSGSAFGPGMRTWIRGLLSQAGTAAGTVRTEIEGVGNGKVTWEARRVG